ncbi:MAG: ATP-dependent DNA ligase, partial [Candidatus Sulfotelmatobacter sp.]
MFKFAQTCEAIAATTKKLQKTAIVAEYLKTRTADEAAVSAVFLSGRAFAAWEETTLQVGGSLLWRIVAELAEKEEGTLTAAYRKHGDLGSAAADVLPERAHQGLKILEVQEAFRQVANARGPTAKSALVRELLAQATPREAKYIVKIITGDLRIGLKESLVEEAITKAYRGALADVQRANMLLGDIGETLRLAAEGQLEHARMRMFHPIGFMLASPIDTTDDALTYFSSAIIEDKYDGIRAQAHVSNGEVKFFSRTRDEITESFPELPGAFVGLRGCAILDGEIVAWDYPKNLVQTREVVDEPPSDSSETRAEKLGSARPFSILQQRLGRKKVSEKMLREIPVAYLAFDVLYADGELLIDRPLRERMQILDDLLTMENHKHRGRAEAREKIGTQRNLMFDGGEEILEGSVIRAPAFRAATPEELEELFVAARAHGNEGLMIKDAASTYTPGKRGKSWLKMKRELATLDVVVTAVEYGHGRRIGVLSDYTFAVWDADKTKLVNIGKAYSG